MRNVVVPRNIQTGVADALRRINRHLEELGAPLLTEKKSLKAITEGTSAYIFEDGQLCRYTKQRGKLYKECIDDDVAAPTDDTTEKAEIQYSSRF